MMVGLSRHFGLDALHSNKQTDEQV
jgi:hypothetical protein